MASLIELKASRKEALDAADRILLSAESAKRNLTDNESKDVDNFVATSNRLSKQIEVLEAKNTIRGMFPDGRAVVDGGTPAEGRGFRKPKKVQLSEDYANDFFRYIQTGGQEKGAALYEGSQPGGGYAVPIVVDDQIVPLAPQEMGVRTLATVIPTTSDIKFPVKAGFGTASGKAENSAFTESDLTLGQFTLSAFMGGIQETVSWELAQDVPAFQATVVDDMILAEQMYEENLYCNGTGSGQAQGLFVSGNVGAGVVEEPDVNGNLVTINGTLDLTGKLNAVYHPNASWLMSRPTSIIIRKAQVQQNLFEPVWTRQGKQDYLHGYPVVYTAYAPTAARGATPVLFGDFKRGYIIGDRGGSGINVKVLDQPAATQGQIILLAYRRQDGRVRRSEAIQAYYIAAS